MIKKSLFFSLFVFLAVTLLSGCAIKKRACYNNKIVVEDSACDQIVSVVKNKSMPEKSKIKSYDLICEDDGKQNSDTFNVVFAGPGKIKEVQVPDQTKAMGRKYHVVSMISTMCEEGQVERCVTVCEWPPGGTPFCYYICVCTDH